MVINHEWRMRLIALSLMAILITTTLWSWAAGGLVHVLLAPEISAEAKLIHVREFFHSWGPAAPLVYFVFVMVEVVIAPVPGAMLYAPGGVIFGGFVGGTLSLLGNVAGAGLSCMLVRWIGGSRITHWFERGKLRETGRLIEKRGLWIILLLRLNPLTSSDLVSYAAGFTSIRVWKVMPGHADRNGATLLPAGMVRRGGGQQLSVADLSGDCIMLGVSVRGGSRIDSTENDSVREHARHGRCLIQSSDSAFTG